MAKSETSRLTQAVLGIVAGVIFGMWVEVTWFWPDSDWLPPKHFVLKLSRDSWIPVLGPIIGASCLATLGAITRGIAMRGMVRALAIGVSIGALSGIVGGLILGDMLSAEKDRRAVAAGLHVPEGAMVDKFSYVHGLLIGIVSGVLLGGVAAVIGEIRGRHRQ